MPNSPGASSFAAEARRQAAQILARSPYTSRPAREPAPLAGVLNAIGRGFIWVFGRPARWLWHHILFPSFHFTHNLLGEGWWIVALVVALGLGSLGGGLLIRRRSRIASRPTTAAPKTEGADLSALERAAAEAEARGENELAVRLRFRLGLGRLEARGAIPDRLTMTSRQLRRVLRSTVFDELASRHESIAYARQAASPRDAASAREGWQRLFAETPTPGSEHRDAGRPAGGSR